MHSVYLGFEGTSSSKMAQGAEEGLLWFFAGLNCVCSSMEQVSWKTR